MGSAHCAQPHAVADQHGPDLEPDPDPEPGPDPGTHAVAHRAADRTWRDLEPDPGPDTDPFVDPDTAARMLHLVPAQRVPRRCRVQSVSVLLRVDVQRYLAPRRDVAATDNATHESGRDLEPDCGSDATTYHTGTRMLFVVPDRWVPSQRQRSRLQSDLVLLRVDVRRHLA